MDARECVEAIRKLKYMAKNKMYEATMVKDGEDCQVLKDWKEELAKESAECIKRREYLIKLLGKLRQRDYELLHMIYIQEMNYDDVAKIRECSYTAVTSAHRRALDRLQKILDEKGLDWRAPGGR